MFYSDLTSRDHFVLGATIRDVEVVLFWRQNHACYSGRKVIRVVTIWRGGGVTITKGGGTANSRARYFSLFILLIPGAYFILCFPFFS